MRVEHVRPFAEASVEVCTTLLGLSPDRGDLTACVGLCTTQQINALCGITGDVEGYVMLSMSARTAAQIAGKLSGVPVVTFDASATSAIAEFANIIGGRSLTLLSESGLVCGLEPPTIIRGSNTPIQGARGPALRIPLVFTPWGEIDLQVSLFGAATQAA